MELAHVSDLHFRWPAGQGPGLGTLCGKPVLGWANALFVRSHPAAIFQALWEDLRADPPAHLVISGDFTTLGLESELTLARDTLAELGLSWEQITLVPGNHDAYTRQGYQSGRFERIFAPALGGLSTHWPRVRDLPEVRLIGLNSAVPTPPFRAYGHLSETQLREAGRLLDEAGERFKVLVVHHPPLYWHGRPDKPSRCNRDGQALLELAQAHGADLILCGHNHHPFSYELVGRKPLRVECAGSATSRPKAVGHKGTYKRYRLEGSRLRESELRAFDPAEGAFRRLRRVRHGRGAAR